MGEDGYSDFHRCTGVQAPAPSGDEVAKAQCHALEVSHSTFYLGPPDLGFPDCYLPAGHLGLAAAITSCFPAFKFSINWHI